MFSSIFNSKGSSNNINLGITGNNSASANQKKWGNANRDASQIVKNRISNNYVQINNYGLETTTTSSGSGNCPSCPGCDSCCPTVTCESLGCNDCSGSNVPTPPPPIIIPPPPPPLVPMTGHFDFSFVLNPGGIFDISYIPIYTQQGSTALSWSIISNVNDGTNFALSIQYSFLDDNVTESGLTFNYNTKLYEFFMDPTKGSGDGYYHSNNIQSVTISHFGGIPLSRQLSSSEQAVLNTSQNNPRNYPISNLLGHFYNINGLTITATDHPTIVYNTNGTNMFQNCDTALQGFDLTTWTNMSNITNMNGMFTNCGSFNQDISVWDVSGVTSMNSTFDNCSIFNIDISQWNTHNVSDMEYTFRSCGSFNFGQAAADSSISVSWDLSRCTKMTALFQNCSSFNQNISGWTLPYVTKMKEMFSGCAAFNQNIGNWDVSNVTNMSGMFAYCPLFNRNLSNWDVSNVTNMSGMFSSNNPTNFNNGDVPGGSSNPLTWNTAKVTDMYAMFQTATSFNQNIGNWNTANVIGMTSMFQNSSFNQNIGNWNTSNVTGMDYMFSNCSSFNNGQTTIGLGTNPLLWNTSRVINMTSMFENCTSFNQQLTFYNNNIVIYWDVGGVRYMEHMFDSCTSFNNGDTSGNNTLPMYWYTGSCQTFDSMFQNCSAFNQPLSNYYVDNAFDISNSSIDVGTNNAIWTSNFVFSASGCNNINNMLSGCSSFNNGQTSIGLGTNPLMISFNTNTTGTITMNNLFNNCISFNQSVNPIYQNGDIWQLRGIKSMNNVFNGCTKFNNGDISGNNANPLCWYTKYVESMSSMFQNCSAFNQNISYNNNNGYNNGSKGPTISWDTGNVTTMESMFYGCSSFNNGQTQIGDSIVAGIYPLNLRTTSVTQTNQMFRNCSKFNQTLSFNNNNNYWYTFQVANMASMFNGCTHFNNGDIAAGTSIPMNWNIIAVTANNGYSGFSNNNNSALTLAPTGNSPFTTNG